MHSELRPRYVHVCECWTPPGFHWLVVQNRQTPSEHFAVGLSRPAEVQRQLFHHAPTVFFIISYGRVGALSHTEPLQAVVLRMR